MKIKCPCCQKELEVSEVSIGAKVRCHNCGEKFYVDAKVVPSEYRISALRARAQQGDKWSQCELGLCYENGDGVEIDPEKAVVLFLKAAKQGYGLAQYNLGVCYDVGCGVERNQLNALKFYLMAAEKGVLGAQIRLGRYYEDGVNGEANYKEAVKWYEKAAKQGSAEALYALGTYYESGDGGLPEDVHAAVKLYRKAADGGCEKAKVALTECYLEGKGVEADAVEAALWYAKIVDGNGDVARTVSAFNGNESEELCNLLKWARLVVDSEDADGMYYLGRCYTEGKVVKKDSDKAQKWYVKAAECGNVEAQREYGESLLLGRSIDIDFEEAHKWLQKAAKGGDHRAQIDMSFLCLHGVGCEADEMAADEWLAKATESIAKDSDGISDGDESEEDESEDAECEEEVEEVVETESEETSDAEFVEKAKKAFGDNRWEEAIELARRTGPKDADLQSWMGNSYEFGYGVEKDLDEAFRWHKSAAENGDGWSQYKLGDFFEHGKGADKNLDEAFKWYKAASGQEIVQAQYRLGVCYEFGKGTAQNLIEAFNLFKVAAEKDYASAQYFLGFCCESGRGTDVDIENARKWYKKAADAGDKEAEEALMRLDDQQEDVVEEKSAERLAIDAFENENWAMGMVLAEKTDLTDARLQYYMGYCYENGFGTAKDIDVSKEWYEKAAEQGNEAAIKRLGCLESSLQQYNDPITQHQDVQVQKAQGRSTKKRRPSKRKAYDEMAENVAKLIIDKYGIDVGEMDNIDDYLYCIDVSGEVDEKKLMDAVNEFFHRICVLEEGRELTLDEETEYCTVHHNEHSGKYFILFNHPCVIEAKASSADVGETVREFGETQREQIAEEESEDDDSASGELTPAQIMKYIADGIKSGDIRSKSGEGYFVLKGEYYDAIEAGRKTTEYRDLTPRNLSLSIGIKTAKFQRGYGHPGQPPEQMRFEVASVGLLDADDRECDPYNIPDGFIATTIAIHLGRRIG